MDKRTVSNLLTEFGEEWNGHWDTRHVYFDCAAWIENEKKKGATWRVIRKAIQESIDYSIEEGWGIDGLDFGKYQKFFRMHGSIKLHINLIIKAILYPES